MNSALSPLQKPLNENPACSYTLPSTYYLDADIFELEKTHIFYKTWQYVAPTVKFPNIGDYATLKICDENVLVIRSADGKLRAFYNVCRHRAHELLSGSGNLEGAIVCPYHAWTYKNDGNLLSAGLSEDRDEFNRAEYGLQEIRLEESCGCVFVNLDENADSLRTMASDMEEDIRSHIPNLEQLQLCGSDMLGETRVAADNFVECYHCASAHPDFASMINMNAYQVDIFDYWSRQLGPKIRNENSAYPVSSSDEVQESAFWYLWPNTTFNIMPGSLELCVYAVRPVDKDSCRFEGEILNVAGKPNQVRADYTANVLAPEDIRLCESVQRGLKSKSYDQGPYIVSRKHSGSSEYALHHFHRLVQKALNE